MSWLKAPALYTVTDSPETCAEINPGHCGALLDRRAVARFFLVALIVFLQAGNCWRNRRGCQRGPLARETLLKNYFRAEIAQKFDRKWLIVHENRLKLLPWFLSQQPQAITPTT